MAQTAIHNRDAATTTLAQLIEEVPRRCHVRRTAGHVGVLRCDVRLEHLRFPRPAIFVSFSGDLLMQVEDEPVAFDRGSVVWMTGNVAYSLRSPRGTGRCGIVRLARFHNDTLAECTPPTLTAWCAGVVQDIAAYEFLFAQFSDLSGKELRQRTQAGGSASVLHAIMLRCLEDLRRPRPSRPSPAYYVDELQNLMNLDPLRRRSADELAAHAHVCPRHLARLFHKYTGLSPRGYQVQARLRFAHDMLREEQLSVKQCASRLGYGDQAVFSRQFRKHFGYPPSHLLTGAARRAPKFDPGNARQIPE